jgi:hypothetical protein
VLRYRTGVAGAPTAAAAMARHLLEHTLSADQAKLAEYYAQGSGLAEALAMGLGCVPSPRADMDSAIADALGIEQSRFLDETELANILGGKRADGTALPGDQREVRRYKAEDGTERHRIAYVDLVLSAPKSVSCSATDGMAGRVASF